MSSTEAFLKSFHLENPGCTPACFSNGQSQGLDSYSLLLSALNESHVDPTTVVDLACGNGALIQRLISRGIPIKKIFGIDMSSGELNLARKELSDSRVEFIEARAQSLPLLNSSVDFIFCHMALMLMDELELVIAEIRRCLKPGGVFSAIVGGKSEISPIFRSFLGLLKQALAEENKTFLYNLGDSRTRSKDGLKSLFSEEHFVHTETQDLKLEFSAKPSEAIDFFMLMYDVGLLSKSRRAQLNSDLLKILESNVDSQGLVNHYIWLRQISSQRR